MPTTTAWHDILGGLNALSDWVKTWAVPLAAVGSGTMALLQTAKSTLPLRSTFQRKHLREWLRLRSSKDYDNAESDLILLATAGDAGAFYSVPIEKLCQQIKGVLSVVLDYPERHQPLLRCLTAMGDPEDVKLLLDPPAVEIFLKSASQSTPEEKDQIRKFVSAKTRVGTEVRCAIDAIQTSIGFRWKRQLQIASLLLSAVLGTVALYIGAGSKGFPTAGAAIMIGILSGFLAPVARDLVAAIEKWRT